MKGIQVFSLFVFLLFFFACASPQKSYHQAIAKPPYDVIIVPGIPYQEQDWASNVMKARVLWSCFLYTKGIARNVIYSGSAVYTPYVEGKIMAMHAVAMGIPRQHVFSETKAEHSTENLVYSYRMAKKLGFDKIAVATDPFQSNILEIFAWDYGMSLSFIPIIYDSLATLHVDSAYAIDPSAAFVKDFVPLPERVTSLRRILGTMGFETDREIKAK